MIEVLTHPDAVDEQELDHEDEKPGEYRCVNERSTRMSVGFSCRVMKHTLLYFDKSQ